MTWHFLTNPDITVAFAANGIRTLRHCWSIVSLCYHGDWWTSRDNQGDTYSMSQKQKCVTYFHVGIIVRVNRWMFCCSGQKLQQEIMIVSFVTNHVITFTHHKWLNVCARAFTADIIAQAPAGRSLTWPGVTGLTYHCVSCLVVVCKTRHMWLWYRFPNLLWSELTQLHAAWWHVVKSVLLYKIVNVSV